MYDIALTVAACLRAGTRADVAWLVEAEGLPVADWSDAVVFTPGGGRTGRLLDGALDGQLMERAGHWSYGRLIDLEVTEVDALSAGLPGPGSVRCLLVPADTIPPEVWDLAGAREPFTLVCRLDGDELQDIELLAGDETTEPETGLVVSSFNAVPQLVVVGSGPVVDALADIGALMGWRTRVVADTSSAAGSIATLSARDKVVVAAHDLELAGAALLAALEGDVGYIGSVGSRRMQEARADWLAYRGMTDLSRVHGPAGLDIGADTPGEIAVSIAAEALSVGTPRGRLAPS